MQLLFLKRQVVTLFFGFEQFVVPCAALHHGHGLYQQHPRGLVVVRWIENRVALNACVFCHEVDVAQRVVFVGRCPAANHLFDGGEVVFVVVSAEHLEGSPEPILHAAELTEILVKPLPPPSE